MYPLHVEKTAVISRIGLFQYNRMLFGLKNVPSTFMRFISSVLGEFPFLFTYIDDILVFSSSREEHYEHLNILLERLNDYD